MSELRKIPNVGKATEADLIAMGYTTIESLRGADPKQLYEQECALRGQTIDRCQLYLYRAVVYWVNTPSPDPEKSKWWYWKDEYLEPAPCGVLCSECSCFPADCKGCRTIEGKVFWLQYTGGSVCNIYDCCVRKGKRRDCGGCEKLPCPHYDLKDPTISDEENEAGRKRNIERLKAREEKR